MDIKIEKISEGSPHLDTVKDLARKNRNTLGFLPEGAFDQYAKWRQILIAINERNECVGYLLFRVAKTNRKVSITHLCVAKKYRSLGIARKLVENLINSTKHLRGIGLFSRRDYSSNSFWYHMGFMYQAEKLGRGRDQIPLSYYWYPHEQLDLFSWVNQQQLGAKSTKAVLDANVFYDLRGTDSDLRTEKEVIAQALLADWLLDDVVLCLTPEIYNEIHRRDKQEERLKNLSFADRFPKVQAENDDDKKNVERYLRDHYFPDDMDLSDESDLCHLVHAIVGGADFFISLDGRLVDEIGDDLFDKFGLSAVRPSDFIVQFDELIRRAEYQPTRLAGTNIQTQRALPEQEKILADSFQATSHETRNIFLAKLRKYLADPHVFQVRVIGFNNSKPLALIVFATKDKQQLEIPLFRVSNDPLSKTVAVHLILQSISDAVRDNRQLILISDLALDASVITALQINHFTPRENGWIKLNLKAETTVNETLNDLSNLINLFPKESEFILRLQKSLSLSVHENNPGQLFEFEKILWPAKFKDAEIPTFIVSINPHWAMNLFDENLGQQTLFGARPELVLNRENVYYRSAHQKILQAPGRILWYITDGKGYQNVKALRACSHLEHVEIGTPKELYRKYKRLGIYQFNDLLEITKGDVTKDIMSFHFSGTWLFPNPIPWRALKGILGRSGPIQSPVRVNLDTFAKIFRLATLGDVRQ